MMRIPRACAWASSSSKSESVPNNWQSIFGGPAWTRVTAGADARPVTGADDETPGQWYLHMFDSTQPDLDWTNPEVRAEFEDVLRFWLDKGVDGFRIDVAHGMVKQDGLPDWDGSVSMVEGTDAGAPEDGSTGAGNSGPMFDQEGVHDIYRAWHKVLAEYDGDRALVAEAWVEPLSRLARYVRPDEMHQAFNFSFLTTAWDAAPLRAVVVGRAASCGPQPPETLSSASRSFSSNSSESSRESSQP